MPPRGDWPVGSVVVRGGLPHDILVITWWGVDGTSFRIYAIATLVLVSRTVGRAEAYGEE